MLDWSDPVGIQTEDRRSNIPHKQLIFAKKGPTVGVVTGAFAGLCVVYLCLYGLFRLRSMLWRRWMEDRRWEEEEAGRGYREEKEMGTRMNQGYENSA